MKFTKMQGLGNDYLYINAFEERVFSGVESLAPDEAALPRGDERAV